MIDSIPYLILMLLVAAFVAVSFRYFGIRGAIAASFLSSMLAAFIIGRREGRADQSQEAAKDAVEIRNKASMARVESERVNADPERLRDDDGFRRD
jgi:hypothetical protein